MMSRNQDELEEMPKRITITLPDEVAQALEDWAKDEGRPTANLATFLLQKAVEDKQKSKEQEKKQEKG